MNDTQIIECCKAVIAFLLEKEHDWTLPFGSHPGYINMVYTLKRYEMGDMISFTRYVNHEVMHNNKSLWNNSAKEFFATPNAIAFFQGIIRHLKIKQIDSRIDY
jgi:hypothetical protein